MSNSFSNIVKDANEIANNSQKITQQANSLAEKISSLELNQLATEHVLDPIVFAITIFVLACFVGYYVVWKVTPALHTPLMAVTNAISGIVIVGAIIAIGPKDFGIAKISGFFAVILAAINIFGGFVVTQRMLAMFRKK